MIKCPVCGEDFWPAPMHIYKVFITGKGYKFVCSWHCLSAWKKEREKKNKKEARKNAAG